MKKGCFGVVVLLLAVVALVVAVVIWVDQHRPAGQTATIPPAVKPVAPVVPPIVTPVAPAIVTPVARPAPLAPVTKPTNPAVPAKPAPIAAPTTAITQPTLAIAVKQLADAKAALAAAEPAAGLGFFQSAQGKALVAARDDAATRLVQARESGTPQEKLDASAAFVRAKSNLAASLAAAQAADPGIAALRKRVLDAEWAVSAARLATEKATARAEDLRHPPIPTFESEKVVITFWVEEGTVKYQSFGSKFESKPLLIVHLSIRNKSDKLIFPYKTWRGELLSFRDDTAGVTDDLGNAYRRIDFGLSAKIAGGSEDESIYPGKEITDVLPFEVPVGKASTFKFRLPGGNVGVEKPIEFEVKRESFGVKPVK